MYKEIVKLLKKYKIPVSAKYFKLRLESHPDYPSLIAAKDTLDELSVWTNVYQTDREHLQKASKPFLVHLNINGGVLLYTESLDNVEKSIDGFNEKWTGIVLLIDSWNPSENAEHNLYMKKEKRYRLSGILSIILILASLLSFSLYHYSVSSFLWLVSNSAGLYLSGLIIQKEMGIRNSVGDKICSFAPRSRCESVLFSRGARLSNWLSWGDIGVTYFSASMLFLLLCLVSPDLSPDGWIFYSYMSITAVFFSVYSLFYQGWIVKQWCMLCVGVLITLLINAFISAGVFLKLGYSTNIILAAGIFSLVYIIHFTVWQIVKILVQRATQSFDGQITHLRFKRDPNILKGLMSSVEVDELNLPQLQEAIRFGSINAPIQIVMACNPYCGPCAQAHAIIEELYEQYPEKIAVNIRFALTNLDESNAKTIAASSILRSVKGNENNTIQVMKDWYSSMNHDEFLRKYEPKDSFVMNVLEAHKNWSDQAQITGTPTLFINGKMLPHYFNWREFTEIIRFDLQR